MAIVFVIYATYLSNSETVAVLDWTPVVDRILYGSRFDWAVLKIKQI